jgi:hypothetical protein
MDKTASFPIFSDSLVSRHPTIRRSAHQSIDSYVR